ncbi:histone-fold-containing protein [Suillus subalutaceus]|uniref:histone-fold-containing protein n=1 Tax=Suillus subalutaceus TaxID=48586 RepID=UPI001B886D71|nr:histone-fold-containing protein [Suillus subalutaceus]KAG1853477.1 histone-fold-containing protein [Suillus subalutaceus]
MSPTTPYVQSGEPLNDFLRSFWQRQVDAAEQETPDYRHPPLPLARIKKVMKSDPDVKMIAADAPILFCKACEIFISEITARAFIIADSNKRRTLSRADIAKALAKSDQFDFLIDIVPREEGLTGLTQSGTGTGAVAGGSGPSMTNLVAGPSQAAPHHDSEHNAGDESGNLPSAVVLDQLQSLLAPSNAMHAP